MDADADVDPDPAVADRLEVNLMSLGVYVERTTRGSGALHVEYETAGAGLDTTEVGNVCSELVDAHGDGWEPVDCRFWVFGTEGGFRGRWAIKAGWLRALDNGNLTETDFSTLVLSTRDRGEDPPAAMPAFGGP